MPATRFNAQDSYEEFIASQRLLTALLPPHRLRALLAAAHGSPSAVFSLPAPALSSKEIALTEKQIERLNEAANAPLPARFLEQTATQEAWFIHASDPAYPANLLPFSDAPPLLCVRGTLVAEDQFAIAIVGSRRATLYGRGQAERFARSFAEQRLTVVSGGASGIDTAAHRGALAVGGRTLSVFGCGVDVLYPSENKSLFKDILAADGALISEFPLGARPEPWRFPARNRIIAGMTRVTLLIETPTDSGAMITARDAAQYGRDVWAVPGPVEGGRSRGCHRLIQDGAGLADAPEDVLSALGIEVAAEAAPTAAKPPRAPRALFPEEDVPGQANDAVPAQAAPIPPSLSQDEQKLLSEFDLTPRHRDEAGARAGLSAPAVAVALTLLEMKGLLRRQPGDNYVRVL